MTDVPYIKKELNMREIDVLKLVSEFYDGHSYDEPRLEKNILEVAEACDSLIAKMKNKNIIQE